MKKFIVEAKRGSWGNLGTFATLEEAELEVERQEADDKSDGNYEKDYYIIREANPAAVALGKLAKGKPKKFSKEEIKKRTERLKKHSRHNKSVVK